MTRFYPSVFLFYFLFTLTSYSQCLDSTMVIISQGQQDNDPMAYTSKQILHFNQAEKQTLSIYYSWLGTNWQPVSKDTLAYLFDTLLSYHERFLWTNNQWQPKIRETWSYVNTTLPDTYLMQRWTGSTWADSLRTVWSYNGSFQLLEKASQVFIAGLWVDNLRSISIYDGLGHLMDSTSYNYSLGSISNGKKYLFYSNGTDDTLIIIKNRSANDTTWYNSSYNRISSDSLHRIVFREQWVWNNGTQWTYTYQTFYSYISNTFRTDTVINKFWTPATLTWNNSQMTVMQYDQYNHLILSTGYHWNGYFWMESNRNILTYNGLLLMQDRYEYYNGTDWEFTYYATYVYDVHGHLIGGDGDSQGSHTDGESNYLFDANGIYIGSNGWHENPYTGESGSWINEVYYGEIKGTNVFCNPGSTTLYTDSCPGASYLWSTGATTASITVNSTDTFSVQVTYPNGYHTYVAPVFVQAQSPVIFSSTTDSILYRCGTIYPTLNFPGNAYTTYQWYKDDSLVPGMTNSRFNGLYWNSHPTQGDYYLVATNSCGSDTSGTTTIVNAGLPNDSIFITGTVPFCDGDSVTLSAPSGYRYQWSPGNDTTQSVVIFTGGYYFLYVTDTTGCTNNNFVSITSFATPAKPLIYRDGPDIILNDSTNSHWYLNGSPLPGNYLQFTPSQSGYYQVEAVNSAGCSSLSDSLFFDLNALFVQAGRDTVVCQFDTLLIGGNYTAYGGTPPYHYQWSPSTGLSNDTLANPFCFSDTTTLYHVVVTDSTGIISSDSLWVNVNPTPVPTVTHDSVPACKDGNFVLTVNPASQSYYEWTKNSFPTYNSVYNQFNIYNAGVYQVKVTNSWGCYGFSAPDTITFFPEVAVPAIVPAGPISLCYGDSIMLHFSPDTSLSYQWYLNDTLIPSITDSSVYGNRSGIYKVVATGNEGCTASASISVFMDSVLLVSVSSGSPLFTCPEDTVRLFTNLIPGYMYQWKMNSVDIIGALNNELEIASTGYYQVQVTSPAGCSGISQGVQVNVFPPATGTVVSRNDTLFFESLSPDFPWYIVWWYDVATQSYATGNYFIPYSNQEIIVEVYNDNTGCLTTWPLYEFIPCPVTFTNTNPVCAYDSTGSISIQLSGIPPYQILWSTGDTGLTRSNLPEGIYTVEVTNGTGCIFTLYDTLRSYSAITIDSIEAIVNCTRQCDDTLYARVSGGLGTVNYFWNTGANTPFIESVCSGIYPITVVDSAGCIAADTLIYSEPVNIQATASSANTSCIGCSDGYILVNILAVTQPYTIDWLPNTGFQSGDTLFNLPAGIYQVTVTDALGCQISLSDTVNDGVISTGLILNEEDFYFYPNPFHTETCLYMNSQLPEGGRNLILRDLLNRVVYEQEINSRTTIIQGDDLAQGVYNYILTEAGKVVATGVLILH